MTHKRKRRAGGRAVLEQRHLEKTTAHSSAPRELTLPADALSGERAGDDAIAFRPSAGRPHALADARWFAANPTRTHHFRRAANDELPAEFVIVRQIEPGVRLRIAVALDDAAKAPALLHAADEVLHVAADLLLAQGCAAPDDVLREVEYRRACGGRA